MRRLLAQVGSAAQPRSERQAIGQREVDARAHPNASSRAIVASCSVAAARVPILLEAQPEVSVEEQVFGRPLRRSRRWTQRDERQHNGEPRRRG